MSAHLAPRRRTPIAGYLAIALGIGMITFALVGDGGQGGGPTTPTVPSSSVPATVLGSVVTRDGLETAEPAVPATFDLLFDPDSGSSTSAPPSSISAPTTSTTDPGPSTTPSTGAPTTSTTTDSSTTTSEPTTSTSESTTTTTEPPTTTTTEDPGTDG